MLPKIQIASPCSANWERMDGNERVRRCADCNLDVHNFSAMTRQEIEALISKHSGRLCARFYQRADGTLLTQDCPVGIRAMMWRASRVAAAALAAILSVRPAMAQSAPKNSAASLTQIQQQERKYDFVVAVRDPLGAAIANTRVVLTNRAAGQTLEGTTDTLGQLSFHGLASGEVSVAAEAVGFATTIALASIPKESTITVTLEVKALMGVIVETPHTVPIFSRMFAGLRRIV